MNKRYVIDYSLKNGLGNPSVNLYLMGCDKPVKCKDCHNWEMQDINLEDFNYQTMIDELETFIKKSMLFQKEPWLCILGGDPLIKENKPITMSVSSHLKEVFPKLKIVVYSWHEPQELQNVDYGVLGPYESSLHIENMLPSSTNQYIYDFNNKTKLEPIKLK